MAAIPASAGLLPRTRFTTIFPLRMHRYSMKSRYTLYLAVLAVAAILAAGCTGAQEPGAAASDPASTEAGDSYTPPEAITTTRELVEFVAHAAEYAREHGREEAAIAFNDPNGTFVAGNTHAFAVEYDGTVVADATEPAILGTDISNQTDPFGVRFVERFEETARFGRGYVSYMYPNPADNDTFEHRIAVVEDVDGTYYVGAGLFASQGEVYPSVALNTSAGQPALEDLVAYVKSAVAYARTNGKEKALAVFNDRTGPFVQGELVMMAFDYNGTNLAAPPYSPELTGYHINLINYYDPDGVFTIRGMRDLAKEGGGFFYTVVKVRANDTVVYVPKIDYAEPVDGDWWIFSGIVVPEYARVGAGDLTGIPVRNHTREEVYDLVNRAVAFAQASGKEAALAEINDPAGRFVNGDLFVWAESADGTVLADPFWKEAIGGNYINDTDRNGVLITKVGIGAMQNAAGFSRALFPNTAANETAEVPKLIYMKAVDETWWIGSGVYGVEVA